MGKMQSVRVPRTLPVILSREEVGRLIAATSNLKHQTALAVAYGTGLRVSEVVSLRVGDIDSERMTLRVEQGKGSKDRYAMLSPILLERLRYWWRGSPRTRQDARRRLAVSRAEPNRITLPASAQSRHP